MRHLDKYLGVMASLMSVLLKHARSSTNDSKSLKYVESSMKGHEVSLEAIRRRMRCTITVDIKVFSGYEGTFDGARQIVGASRECATLEFYVFSFHPRSLVYKSICAHERRPQALLASHSPI
jgi:hypothetical protein